MKTIAKFIILPLIFASLIGAALWHTRPDLFQIGLHTLDKGPLGTWNPFSGEGKGDPGPPEAAADRAAGQPSPAPLGGMPWGGIPPPFQQGAANPAWQPPMRYAPAPQAEAPPQPPAGQAPMMRHPMPPPMPPRQEDGYLNGARAAFWEQDADAAVTAYKALTEGHGDNPDVWGELGNVYLSQGKMDEATEAYAKAAGLLIEQGHFRRLTSLINVIGWKKPDEALKLMGAMAAKQREMFAPAPARQQP